jgi:hypothetical protein
MIDQPTESPIEEWELLGSDPEPEPEEESFDPFDEEEEEDPSPPAFDVEKYNFRQPSHPSRKFQSARQIRANQKKKVFLRILAQTCNVGKAAEACGYTNSVTMNRMRHADPEFAKAWDEALAAGVDVLEREAYRRAVEGIDKPRAYKGEIMYYEREYSDTLLLRLLKAHSPERFGDNTKNQTDININTGVVILPAKIADADEWEKQAALYDKGSTIIDITPNNAKEQKLIDSKPSLPQDVKIKEKV